VLDVATGTGAVALELVRQHGCRVVGVDQSPEMLAEARRRVGSDVEVHLRHGTRVEVVEASADSLPFADGEFDGLTFTYLLRYVADPAATLQELARVVRPGGTIGGLEFGVPPLAWRLPWELYVRAGLPAAGAVIGGGWREVGSFLGPSIRDFYARWPLPRLEDAWRAAGMERVSTYRLSFGAGVVTWGRRT
jgi:demethylmenaquinone methyltransferase/2-methoxy-6-polyprenyl-1,4-benzoquinol methylase